MILYTTANKRTLLNCKEHGRNTNKDVEHQLIRQGRFTAGLLSGSCISFACAYSKMEYKVLCTYGPDGGKHNCVMLTLGKDHAWKPINRQKLSDRGWSMVRDCPLSVGQFLYWADHREQSVVALDVESALLIY
ncbi:hypothetical protein RHMOL_Rhmol05G0265000 [Rhododendron molle]|uniref:Uncharacterized protein n=1 Tax=Rhododendron molle TaxID=49168 RepID=A0ACC0NT69_RHOML|nr:hypothetical protein RHMOL_Rhmol05G0265000 [Rhododendron molle]